MQRAQRHYTVEEYFSLERSSNIRLEYYQGEIFALAGASRIHNRIAMNIAALLREHLRDTDYEPFAIDMRLETPGGLYTYPEVMVVCGPAVLANVPLETVTNPIVLVEVLSESTREFDRGDKFELYKAISTLRDYVLIEQASVAVEHVARDREGNWSSKRMSVRSDSLHLASIDVVLKLVDIYERVEL